MVAAPRAIIIYGPSGSGKSALAGRIVEEYGYVHCDADAFKLMVSLERSRMRSVIGEETCYAYAKALIAHRQNIILEALPMAHLARLRRLMRGKGYAVSEVSLRASLERCLMNNTCRGSKRHDSKTIRDVYPLLVKERGLVIDVERKSVAQAYVALKNGLCL